MSNEQDEAAAVQAAFDHEDDSSELPPTVRDRMRVRSQSPELDDIFVPAIDFPGTVVRPGAYAERSFAVGRECRVASISLPKGLRLDRIIVKTGNRFRAIEAGRSGVWTDYTRYEGKDCHVYFGPEAVTSGGWKKHRLTPESQAGLYLLVYNATDDELRFEGTIRFTEDRVPEPEHEEV